jgi:hypothetical protein
MGKYQVDATINAQNMLQRIHTRVPDPVIGDMNYEHEFTNASYVEVGGGVKFPTVWHHHEGWDDNYATQTIQGGHNALDGRFDNVQPNVCPDPVAVPDSVRPATFPVQVETQKLAEGVYLLGGAPHNSVAVEFKDYIAVVEAPHNEERSWAVIEEVVRLMPDKPIRYLVNTHQHHDSIGGLRTYMHIGATIITHAKNYAFYSRDVMNYQPRTLNPDMLALWPVTELAEGYFYENVTENYVLANGGRVMHMSYVHPLEHVEGMLLAYLPQERMIIESDLLDTHMALPQTPTDGHRALRNQVQRLKLDVATIVPIHGKPMPWAEFARHMSSVQGQ